MIKFSLTFICSLFFSLSLYADVLPESIIESQQEDQNLCFQSRLSHCLQKCISSSDTNCRAQCETVSRNECRQAGE